MAERRQGLMSPSGVSSQFRGRRCRSQLVTEYFQKKTCFFSLWETQRALNNGRVFEYSEL